MIVAILFAIILQLAFTAQAQDSKETTSLFNELFRKGESKFNDIVNSTFRNLDTDKVFTTIEFCVVMNGIFLLSNIF